VSKVSKTVYRFRLADIVAGVAVPDDQQVGDAKDIYGFHFSSEIKS
jgi:hypothetical protein